MKIENKFCKCNEPINVEHEAFGRTMYVDGLRFFTPGDSRNNVCLFRCVKCLEVIEYEDLKGAL